jgi:hypothetical protein
MGDSNEAALRPNISLRLMLEFHDPATVRTAICDPNGSMIWSNGIRTLQALFAADIVFQAMEHRAIKHSQENLIAVTDRDDINQKKPLPIGGRWKR